MLVARRKLESMLLLLLGVIVVSHIRPSTGRSLQMQTTIGEQSLRATGHTQHMNGAYMNNQPMPQTLRSKNKPPKGGGILANRTTSTRVPASETQYYVNNVEYNLRVRQLMEELVRNSHLSEKHEVTDALQQSNNKSESSKRLQEGQRQEIKLESNNTENVVSPVKTQGVTINATAINVSSSPVLDILTFSNLTDFNEKHEQPSNVSTSVSVENFSGLKSHNRTNGFPAKADNTLKEQLNFLQINAERIKHFRPMLDKAAVDIHKDLPQRESLTERQANDRTKEVQKTPQSPEVSTRQPTETQSLSHQTPTPLRTNRTTPEAKYKTTTPADSTTPAEETMDYQTYVSQITAHRDTAFQVSNYESPTSASADERKEREATTTNPVEERTEYETASVFEYELNGKSPLETTEHKTTNQHSHYEFEIDVPKKDTAVYGASASSNLNDNLDITSLSIETIDSSVNSGNESSKPVYDGAGNETSISSNFVNEMMTSNHPEGQATNTTQSINISGQADPLIPHEWEKGLETAPETAIRREDVTIQEPGNRPKVKQQYGAQDYKTMIEQEEANDNNGEKETRDAFGNTRKSQGNSIDLNTQSVQHHPVAEQVVTTRTTKSTINAEWPKRNKSPDTRRKTIGGQMTDDVPPPGVVTKVVWFTKSSSLRKPPRLTPATVASGEFTSNFREPTQAIRPLKHSSTPEEYEEQKEHKLITVLGNYKSQQNNGANNENKSPLGTDSDERLTLRKLHEEVSSTITCYTPTAIDYEAESSRSRAVDNQSDNFTSSVRIVDNRNNQNRNATGAESNGDDSSIGQMTDDRRPFYDGIQQQSESGHNDEIIDSRSNIDDDSYDDGHHGANGNQTSTEMKAAIEGRLAGSLKRNSVNSYTNQGDGWTKHELNRDGGGASGGASNASKEEGYGENVTHAINAQWPAKRKTIPSHGPQSRISIPLASPRADSEAKLSPQSATAASRNEADVTATNWWHALPYAEIGKFLKAIFDSAAIGVERKSKDTDTSDMNTLEQWLADLWSAWTDGDGTGPDANLDKRLY